MKTLTEFIAKTHRRNVKLNLLDVSANDILDKCSKFFTDNNITLDTTSSKDSTIISVKGSKRIVKISTHKHAATFTTWVFILTLCYYCKPLNKKRLAEMTEKVLKKLHDVTSIYKAETANVISMVINKLEDEGLLTLLDDSIEINFDKI